VSSTDLPQVVPAGDAALLATFANEIRLEVNARVRTVARALDERAEPGILESVVAYATLLVHYDPLRLSYEQARALLLEVAAVATAATGEDSRLVDLPTVFGGAYGPDLPDIAQRLGMAEEQLIQAFIQPTYTVYMLGFAPGHPYLGGLPPQLAMPRLESPRARVPAGTVAIANQATIYSLTSPGGWHWLGRTPIKMFDPSRNPPTHLQAGDRVRFVPISEQEYLRLGGQDEEKPER